MKSIAVTKPDMGVLSRERMILSPFGALAQAFAEELLARAEQTEGAWSFVPLELLEEGETTPASAPPPPVTLQVDLHLVLDALRREGIQSEQRRATERIVERILRLQDRRERPGPNTGGQPAAGAAQPMTVLGAVRQEFHHHLTQNIHITPSLSREIIYREQQAPGELARQAEAFSQRLQTLREEGRAFPREAGPDGDGAHVFPLPAADMAPPPGVPPKGTDLPPQEALDLLEEQGGQAAREAEAAQRAALLREGRTLQRLLEKAGEERPPAAPAAEGPMDEGGQPRPGSLTAPAATAARSGGGTITEAEGSALPPVKTAGQSAAGEAAKAFPESHTLARTARDIRMSPEAPGTDFDTTHDILPEPRQEAASAQPPLELSHRTEGESKTAAPAEGAVRPAPAGEAAEAAGRQAPSSPHSQAGQEPQSAQFIPTAGGMIPTAQSEGGRAAAAGPGLSPAQAAGQSAAGEAAKAFPGSHTLARTARDIRMSPEGPVTDLDTTHDMNPEPRQEAAASAQPPLELSHRTEGESKTAAPAAETQGEARQSASASQAGWSAEQGVRPTQPRPAGQSIQTAGQTVPAAQAGGGQAASVGETSGRAPAQAAGQSAAGEAAKAFPESRTLARAARDIRMSPEGPGADLDTTHDILPEPRQEAASAQPPLELSHRTEGESKTAAPAEGAVRPAPAGEAAEAAGRQAPSSPHSQAGQEPQSAQSIPTAGGMIPTAQSEGGRAAAAGPGLSPAQAAGQSAAGEAAKAFPGSHTLARTARDIRMSPEGPGADLDTTHDILPEPRQETAASAQPPLELSHRTEGESKTAAPAEGAVRPAPAREPAEAAGRQAPSFPHSQAGQEPQSAQSIPTAGGMIPTVQSEGGRAAAAGPGLSPAQAAGQSAIGEAAKAFPGSHTLARTARDIRMSPEAPGADFDTTHDILPEPRQEAASAQPPLELSHRTEGESKTAAPAAGTQGEARQSASASQAARSAEQGVRPTQPRPAGQTARPDRSIQTAGQTVPAAQASGGQASHPGRASGPFPAQAAGQPAAGQRAGHMPESWTLARTARDIRTRRGASLRGQSAAASPVSHAGRALAEGEAPAAAMAPPTGPEMILPHREGSASASGAAPQGFPAPAEAEGTWSVQGRTDGTLPPPETVDLTYGPVQAAAAPQQVPPASRPQGTESDYVRSLPDWARRFLQEGGAAPGGTPPMGVARDIATLPPPETGDTVQWTAPNYQPPQTPMTYREKGKGEADQPQTPGQVRISEAEIQQTADKVYRIIEDRIRRERRRLGF